MMNIDKMITVFYGCMFSGKTTMLLNTARDLQNAESSFIVIKHTIDSRYVDGYVCSHDMRKWEAHISETLLDIDVSEYDHILIDEAQFFSDVVDAAQKWSKAGKYVYASGLDLDSGRNIFGMMGQLIEAADVAMHLFARCECGGKACYSSRREVASKNTILVGGEDVYEPTCEICYY